MVAKPTYRFLAIASETMTGAAAADTTALAAGNEFAIDTAQRNC